MKRVNRGKDFEGKIRDSIEKVSNTSIDRLPDPVGGYMGVRNICDFYIYQFPTSFYLECKATYDNTLNFKSDITENQWNGLLEKSVIRGVVSGYAVWFIEWDTTVFVPATEMKRLQDEGKKSLNILDIQNNTVQYIPIPGVKKIVFFDYDGAAFIHSIQQYGKQLWGWGK